MIFKIILIEFPSYFQQGNESNSRDETKATGHAEITLQETQITQTIKQDSHFWKTTFQK